MDEPRAVIPWHGPHSGQGQVMLYTRNTSLAVVFHPHERKLRVRRATVCPTCHQPVGEQEEPFPTDSATAPFGDSEYFRLLQTVSAGHEPSGHQSGDAEDRLSDECLNRGYFERFFVKGRRLGSGGFGSVFVCTHRLEGIQLGTYAVKMVPVGVNRSILLSRIHEVTALERVRHPNVVQYKHSWVETFQHADFGPPVPCLFILMEYADAGNLADYIWPSARRPRILSDEQIWKFFIDILLGLDYLHSVGVVHRDVKPQNLVLTSTVDPGTHQQTLRVLISDFGTSTFLSEMNAFEIRKGNTGTVHFMAPELLQTDTQGRYINQHTFYSDIWGLGVVLYAMCYNALPFDGADSDTVARMILEHRLNPHTERRRPAAMEQLIESMLAPNPRDRPLTGQILALPAVRAVTAVLGKPGSEPMQAETNKETAVITTPSEALKALVKLSPPRSPVQPMSAVSSTSAPRSPTRIAPAPPRVHESLQLQELPSTPTPTPRTLASESQEPQRRAHQHHVPVDYQTAITHVLLFLVRLVAICGACEGMPSQWYTVPAVVLLTPLVMMAFPSRKKSVVVAAVIVALQYLHATATLLSSTACSQGTLAFGAMFGAIVVHALLLLPSLVAVRGVRRGGAWAPPRPYYLIPGLL